MQDIERDISEEINGIDKFLFSDFIRACACRVSQVLNIHPIANDVGISDDTAKRWLYVLENYVINEIIKTYQNECDRPLIYYYRDTNGNEIDLCIKH